MNNVSLRIEDNRQVFVAGGLAIFKHPLAGHDLGIASLGNRVDQVSAARAEKHRLCRTFWPRHWQRGLHRLRPREQTFVGRLLAAAWSGRVTGGLGLPGRRLHAGHDLLPLIAADRRFGLAPGWLRAFATKQIGTGLRWQRRLALEKTVLPFYGTFCLACRRRLIAASKIA